MLKFPSLYQRSQPTHRRLYLRRARARTHGGKVHEEGEGDDPELHGVEYVATIELEEEPALDTWVVECSTR